MLWNGHRYTSRDIIIKCYLKSLRTDNVKKDKRMILANKKLKKSVGTFSIVNQQKGNNCDY